MSVTDSCQRPGVDYQALLCRTPDESAEPLFKEASDEVNEVMNDYGNAIKQLAAANIFW